MLTSERPIYGLYRLLWSGLDYVYPPLCGGCGKRGKRWCDDCVNSLKRIHPPICGCCGRPFSDSNLCPICLSQPPNYTELRSWAIYCDPIRKAIHKLKYRRDIALGDALADELIEVLDVQDWHIDLVIPVPLGKRRQKERGFNQAAMIAMPIALSKGLPYKQKALVRKTETFSQVRSSKEQRIENVRNAFLADPKIVRGYNVLVVDDVTTTGATMNACATALREAGAEKVYGLTLARAG